MKRKNLDLTEDCIKVIAKEAIDKVVNCFQIVSLEYWSEL